MMFAIKHVSDEPYLRLRMVTVLLSQQGQLVQQQQK